MTRRPTRNSSATNTPRVPKVKASAATRFPGSNSASPSPLFERAGERRQQHEGENRRDVLDDRPADGDVPAFGLHQVAVLERARENNGAGDRERQAVDDPAADGESEHPAHQRAEAPDDNHLRQSAGDRDVAHGEQVGERKMEPDAEHQEDDADIGELRRQPLIGDECRA